MSLDPYRARMHRGLLRAAALYNGLFGAWAVLDPGGFFRLFEMDPPRYPAIWSCLGMVVGLYGLVYAYAARNPERARPLVAIGLLGKILGPIGWVLAVSSGEWPVRTLPLVVFDDAVWWIPFALILLEGTRVGERLRALAPWACGGLNALASLAMLVLLRPGTEAVDDVAARAAYIADHALAWRAGWAVWMLAGPSLVLFYAWWGARLENRRVGPIAVAIAATGLACDLAAESLYAGWLPRDLEAVGRVGTLLTGAAANGLYTVAGVVLTLASPPMRGWLRAWTWAVWAAGFALSASTLAASAPAMVGSTAALMALFCPWTVVFGRNLPARRAP